MTTEQFDTLLPLNQDIDHDGKTLKLNRKLGEGYTGIVYQGELISEDQYQGELISEDQKITVAVKALKKLDFPEASEIFRHEALTLSKFSKYEEDANEHAGTPGLRITPYYYGGSKYKEDEREIEYIVMEFIHGIQIPFLLEKQRGMAEKDALVVAWQFFRVLNILHTDFKKVFIDLKLENLWWVAGTDGKAGQLKVTDFGTLAEIKTPAQVEHDLLMGGIILFTILTGYTPRYNAYGLKESIEPVLQNYSLSWGTQQIVRRLLHRNPNQRFSTAEEISDELREWANFWDMSDEDLHDLAMTGQERVLTTDPENPKVRIYLRKARAAFDILRLRNSQYKPDEVSISLQDIEKLWDKNDYLNIGIDLFRGGSWQKAAEIFEQGKEWSNSPAKLRRWAYLCKAFQGNTIPDGQLTEYREQLIQAIDWLNGESWSAARQRFEEMASPLNQDGVKILLAECEFSENIKNGENAKNLEQYGRAAEYYKAALDALKKLPDREFIQKVEFGDISNILEEMERLERTRGQARKLLDDAFENCKAGSFETIEQNIIQAYVMDPEYPNFAAILEQLAYKLIAQQKFEKSDYILSLGLKLKNVPNDFLAIWGIVRKLNYAKRALSAENYLFFEENIRSVCAECAKNPCNPHIIDCVHKMLTDLRDIASKRKEIELLELTASLLDICPNRNSVETNQIRSEIESLKKEQNKIFYEKIDKIMAQIVVILDDRKNENNNLSYLNARREQLSQAFQMIGDAECINQYAKYRVLEISSKRKRLEDEKNLIGQYTADEIARQQKSEEEMRQKIRILQKRWEHIEILRDWILEDDDIEKDNTIKAARETYYYKELTKLRTRIHRFLYDYPNNDEATVILNRVKSRLPKGELHCWQELAGEVKIEIDKINKTLKIMQENFEQGNWEKVAVASDIYENAPEWEYLSAKVKNVANFKNWEKEHQQQLAEIKFEEKLISSLNDYLSKGIPLVYWKDGPAQKYLFSLEKKMKEETAKLVKEQAGVKFVSSLTQWIKLKFMVRQFETR